MKNYLESKVNFPKVVSDAFEKLSPDIHDIYVSALDYNLSSWKTLQSSLVTASGVASATIPGMHLVGIPADILFLMNRMSVCSYGVGAIILSDAGLGNRLEKEDFPIILGRFCKEPGLTNASISKIASTLSTKVGQETISKKLSQLACQQMGILIGRKLGGNLGKRLGGKFAARLGGKVAGGLIPILGAVISGASNLYFIKEIQKEAEEWYTFKVEISSR